MILRNDLNRKLDFEIEVHEEKIIRDDGITQWEYSFSINGKKFHNVKFRCSDKIDSSYRNTTKEQLLLSLIVGLEKEYKEINAGY